MKKSKDYGLLIASMVAIVAIVGLVIMFSSGTTGAAGFPASEKMRCVRMEGEMLCGSAPFEKLFASEPRSGAWQPDTETTKSAESTFPGRVEHSPIYGTDKVTNS